MADISEHRTRNVDWARAAALLYGDWGTSKAYVIGLAFAATAFSSMPIILAVCLLTGLVGANYAVICRCFPDGGGVYSAARAQGRTLAVIGALLLTADLLVTASLSAFEAMHYLGVPNSLVVGAAIASILVFGVLNSFGPKHSGSVAVGLAIPTVAVVVILILLAAPHLTTTHFEPSHESLSHNWVAFVSVILALSGVEAIANLTGVMKLDKGASAAAPQVGRTALKAILPVAIEVTAGTALLGWAMLSLPKEMKEELASHKEDMIRFLAEHYGTVTFGLHFGEIFGWVTGLVFFLLLMSAVNTAIAALIGLLYMLARDGELPRPFLKLNRYGVPVIPLLIACVLPCVVLLFTGGSLESLGNLYAIGVVSAIALNLGSCASNPKLPVKWYERTLMAVTFVIVGAVALTLAWTKHEALFFVCMILIVGMGLRSWAQKRSGLETVTVRKEVAEMISPESLARLEPRIHEGVRILVAARGVNPVLRYAFEQARLLKGTLYVVYVKEIAVFMPTSPETQKAKWQDDPQAYAIMSVMLNLGKEHDVPVLPIFVTSTAPALTILDLAATLGVDMLMLGASHRLSLGRLLKGNVVNEVALGLPEDIQLVIYG
ncbi:MAG TPA: universal stress protein [Chthoniobacterales bacterium]